MQVSKSLPELLHNAEMPMRPQTAQTVTSLTEGFAGFSRTRAMKAPHVDRPPDRLRSGLGSRPGSRPGTSSSGDSDSAPGVGVRLKDTAVTGPLNSYYRIRQMVLETERSGTRVPQALTSKLRMVEAEAVASIRPLNRPLFQCFDDMQLGRMIRSMPFLRLAAERWIFDSGEAAWPKGDDRTFLLFTGAVRVIKPNDTYVEILGGTVFGQQHFRINDEKIRDETGVRAQCLEPCIIGILSRSNLRTSFADLRVGNHRTAKKLAKLPTLQHVTQWQEDGAGFQDAGEKYNKVMEDGLKELARVGTKIHIPPGLPVLSKEPLSESLLIVTHGELEVRGKLTLRERLEYLPPKRVRMNILVKKAEELQGDSIFDKLDPYCIVKLGSAKRFQTQMVNNAGKNVKWMHTGVLKWDDEELLVFEVYDYDKYSADDLCGEGMLPMKQVLDGWDGVVPLTYTKKGIFAKGIEVPGGKLFVKIWWDLEYPDQRAVKLKEKSFEDQLLFELPVDSTWGAEQLLLGEDHFRNVLQQCDEGMKYELIMGPFRIISKDSALEQAQALKVTKKRFVQFLKYCSRYTQMETVAKTMALERKAHLKDLFFKLIKKWDHETNVRKLQGAPGTVEAPSAMSIDPSIFRAAYRGKPGPMHICVRNAVNLVGGGWFDKLDPYCRIKFRKSNRVCETPVLQDAGGNPIWDFEDDIIYEGEDILDIEILDKDIGKSSNDDLIAVGSRKIEDIMNGFEGMVNLAPPEGSKKKPLKQMAVVIGISWEPMYDDERSSNAGSQRTSIRG